MSGVCPCCYGRACKLKLARDAHSGDSWRVRASHITEMQVNMAFHGMKIDFGGMDRWDYSERKRNIDYATAAAQAY